MCSFLSTFTSNEREDFSVHGCAAFFEYEMLTVKTLG